MTTPTTPAQVRRSTVEEEASIESALRFSDSEYHMAFREGFLRCHVLRARQLSATQQAVAEREARIAAIRAVVEAHCTDLERCRPALREWSLLATDEQFALAVTELRAVLKEPT